MNNKIIIFVLIALIVSILLVSKLKLQKPNTKKVDSNLFFNDLVKFVQRMEGGLTGDKTDTASKFPLKGVYTVNNKTFIDPHTNKGITYKTFTDTLGTNATPKLFLDMPDKIWLDIFKNKYLSKATGITGNELLDGYLALWFWGGWNKSLMPISKVTNALASGTTKEKLKKLVDLRIEYFNNIVKNNPSQSKFLKGWTNRANDFYKEFEKYA